MAGEQEVCFACVLEIDKTENRYSLRRVYSVEEFGDAYG
jgi:hypothetical protein